MTNLTGSLEPPVIPLDHEIAVALDRRPAIRDELVMTITRRMNPVPVDGERSIRERFYLQFDQDHRDATPAQRSTAWRNSRERHAYTRVRSRITWCAELLADSEPSVEMSNVECILDDMTRYARKHWSFWVDSSESQAHTLAILTKATIGVAMTRHAALVGMDDQYYRMLGYDRRAALLISAWCAADQSHEDEVRATLGLVKKPEPGESVDDSTGTADTVADIDDNITQRRRQMDRRSLSLLFDALDDDRDVSQLSDADVLHQIRNIAWPESMSEDDCIDVLAACGIPRSRTNPTWLTDHVHHDGERWQYNNRSVDYLTCNGHTLADNTDIRDAVREHSRYDWLAYNDAKRISAGPYKSSPKADVAASRLINDSGRLAQRYDVTAQRFTTEKVKENLESVRVNASSSFVRTVVFDIDHANAMDRIRSGLVPPPTYIVESTTNGHAHAAYVLRVPLFDQSSWTVIDAIRSRLGVVLGADRNFTHGYTKNPFSPSFRTHWGPSFLMYDVDTLFMQSCAALEWHMDKPLGLRLYSSDRSGTNKLMKLCDAAQCKSARSDHSAHADASDSTSRHQRTFDATRQYAYSSWSSLSKDWFDVVGRPDLFRKWSEDVKNYAMRIGHQIRESSSSRSAFDTREMEQIAQSVVTWMRKNYRPKVSRSASQDQSHATQRSVARAFESLADDLRRAFSVLGRRCHRQLRVDAETRTIVLPDGVDVREAQRIYRRAFPGERLNAARCRRFLVSGDVVQREQAGRSLAELDTAERTRIVAHAMSTSKKTSWSMIEKRFRLKSGVLGRLIDAYKKHPSRVVDDETMTSADARARWQNSLRSDGSLVHPQQRSRSRMYQESFDAHTHAGRVAHARSQQWTDVSDLDADTLYRLLDSEDAEKLFSDSFTGDCRTS